MALQVLLLLSLAITQTIASNTQGGLMTFRPVERHHDGTVEVSFHYKESTRGQCAHQLTWSCDSGDCGQVFLSEVTDTDEDKSALQLWCQSEGHILRNISNDKPFTLKDTGCCLVSNLNNAARWTLLTKVDMGIRSDTHTLNKSPVMTTIPTIRIPQNCFSTFPLLIHDPDGDQVRCKFGQAAEGNCQSCHQHPDFILNENFCSLQMNNTPSVGVHVFEMVVEDYPAEDITLSYNDGTSSVRSALNLSAIDNLIPLSQLPFQFTVEIQSPLTTCVPGVVRPQFLSPTPSHGDILYAAVGFPFELTLRAHAIQSTIYDFQISGPRNMSKAFQSFSTGTAQVHISWTPPESDVYRRVPVCFTAETNQIQSEMRCIIVIVERTAVLSGEANISCTENTITIILSKSSMRGVEENQLRLKDPTCSLTSNASHIMGIVSLNSCGTRVEDTGDYIVFRNEINSVEEAGSVITRRNLVKIPFSCSYPKLAHVSTNFKNHKSDYVFTETGFGSFSYSFEFYTDSTFNSIIDPSSYPVDVKLLDMVCIGIQAHSTLPQVQLFVESCKATPDDNPNNPLYYDIIKNGCPMDETLVTFPSNVTKFNFEIQAFKFNGDFDQVYISCSVILCEAGNPNSRCAQGCVPNAARRRKRQLFMETHGHFITQGPLRLEGRTLHTSAPDKGSSYTQSSNVTTPVFAGLFVISLLLLAGAMVYNIKRNRFLSRNHLLSAF